MGFEPFWYHFWRLGIFDVFAWKITFLMWEKNRHQSIVFLVTIFSLQITTIISALNFPNFKLKLIITFDIIAVDNFYDHIWNQHIMLVKILKYEGNQRGKKSPPTHQPTHTTRADARALRCLALDPEGRDQRLEHSLYSKSIWIWRWGYRFGFLWADCKNFDQPQL